jgi:hypothetical protein
MNNSYESTLFRDLHDFPRGHGRRKQLTAKGMSAVVRQEDDFTRTHLDGVTPVRAQVHASLSYEVGGNDMAGSPQKGLAIVGGDLSADTPRPRELSLEKHSAGEANHAQNV